MKNIQGLPISEQDNLCYKCADKYCRVERIDIIKDGTPKTIFGTCDVCASRESLVNVDDAGGLKDGSNPRDDNVETNPYGEF